MAVPATLPRPSAGGTDENATPRILLVDDESTGRRLLRRWVERSFEGEVVEASNGMEALAAGGFDLVVLDLMMPVLDGTETLSLIRSDPNYGNVEVVIASQIASEQKIRDVIALGVADYILKPLRYAPVVQRLRQIIEQGQQKKKERQRQHDLPTILIADSDSSFCDFAVSALSSRFKAIVARSAAETLIGVHKNEPHLVMLSTNLPGLPFEVLSKKVLALVTARHGKVCLLAEKRLDSVGEAFAGQIVRTFVPETFAAEVAELLAGAALGESGESWMKSLEPEITSAVRQALGMMTGSEPTFGENASEDVDADLFGVIELQASNGEFDLVVDLHCQRVFAVALCTAMLGGEADDVDDELLMSGVGEILNVVAGRIKNSCADRKIGITPGLPKLFDSTPDELDPFYAWEQNFIWRKQHRFRLRVSGKAGTARPADAATAADSPAAPAEDRPAAAKQPGAPAGDVASQTRAEPRSAEPHTGGPAPEAEASAGATRVASSRAEAGPADASSGGDVQETTESDGAAQGAEGED